MLGPFILVVENSLSESSLLKIILESDGYIVDTASSGWAALEKLKGRSYRLAILDFGLSDMKGDELAERMKKEDPNLVTFLLTGFKQVLDPIKLAKFDCVFEKPVDPKKILDAVKQVTPST